MASSEPPILVHFIPMSVRTPPKKPVATDATASARHAWRNAGGHKTVEEANLSDTHNAPRGALSK